MVMVIEKKWTKEEVLDRIAKLKARKAVLEELGEDTVQEDLHIDSFKKRFAKLKTK